MKLEYARPAITSVRESDLESVLGPVLLSSVDLSTVQPGSTATAIHSTAAGFTPPTVRSSEMPPNTSMPGTASRTTYAIEAVGS